MVLPDAIVVENLSKRFDPIDAVAGISLGAQRGELFGFLGPNGAGSGNTTRGSRRTWLPRGTLSAWKLDLAENSQDSLPH